MNLVSTTARQVTFIWIGAGLLAAVALWPRQSANAQALSPTLVDPNLAVRTVVSGLIQPTTMAFLGDNDFFVLEKASGKVQRVVNGTCQATSFDWAVKNPPKRVFLVSRCIRTFRRTPLSTFIGHAKQTRQPL